MFLLSTTRGHLRKSMHSGSRYVNWDGGLGEEGLGGKILGTYVHAQYT